MNYKDYLKNNQDQIEDSSFIFKDNKLKKSKVCVNHKNIDNWNFNKNYTYENV